MLPLNYLKTDLDRELSALYSLHNRLLSLLGVMPSADIARLLKKLEHKPTLLYVRDCYEIKKELDLFDEDMVNLVNR